MVKNELKEEVMTHLIRTYMDVEYVWHSDQAMRDSKRESILQNLGPNPHKVEIDLLNASYAKANSYYEIMERRKRRRNRISADKEL